METASDSNVDNNNNDSASKSQNGSVRSGSKMEESIKKYGSQSYYYAWTKGTGGAAKVLDASERKPVRVDSVVSQASVSSAKRIQKYAWWDDDKKVKISVSLEPMPETDGDVRCHFDVQGLDLMIRDGNGQEHRLRLPILNARIKPADCTARKRKTNVVVSLVKEKDWKWYNLTSEKLDQSATTDDDDDVDSPLDLDAAAADDDDLPALQPVDDQ